MLNLQERIDKEVRFQIEEAEELTCTLEEENISDDGSTDGSDKLASLYVFRKAYLQDPSQTKLLILSKSGRKTILPQNLQQTLTELYAQEKPQTVSVNAYIPGAGGFLLDPSTYYPEMSLAMRHH